MAVDHTLAFKQLYSERLSAGSSSGPSSSKPRSSTPVRPPSVEQDEFLAEAYRIHNHIQGLLAHLASIKRQYLAIPTPSSGLKGKSRESASSAAAGKIFGEKEREEFDLQAKILLKRCLERVLNLEKAEDQAGGVFTTRKRKGKENLNESSTSSRLLSLLLPPSLIPSLSSPTVTFRTLIAAHHASILFHLHSSLSRAGQALSALQEERVRRLTEVESRSLGGGLSVLMDRQANGRSAGEAGNKKAFSVPDAPVIRREGESALTEDQVQLFESENVEMMKTYDSHLEEIQKTQQTLMQISTLQSLLSQSLMQQSETSDRLLLEAGQGVSDVKAGNEQLRKAHERGGSGRVMLLTFLIGASLALLFVDWYS